MEQLNASMGFLPLILSALEYFALPPTTAFGYVVVGPFRRTSDFWRVPGMYADLPCISRSA